MNKNDVTTITHNEYKDVLLNNKCLKRCFDDKIYIQNNGYDGLALGYKS